MKKVYKELYKKVEYISNVRNKYPRHFILGTLIFNIIVSLFLYLGGFVGVYRIFFAVSALIVVYTVIRTKDHFSKSKIIENSWFIQDYKYRSQLSTKRKAYFLEQRPDIKNYLELPWQNIYILLCIAFMPTLGSILGLPKELGAIFFFGCLIYILFILYCHYKVRKAYRSLVFPEDLQYKYLKIRWSSIFTQDSVRWVTQTVQSAYQKGKENGVGAKVGAAVLTALTVDTGHAWWSDKRPYVIQPDSYRTYGWWTEEPEIHAKARELKHAGYDVPAECIKPGSFGKLDNTSVFKMHEKYYDENRGTVYSKEKYEKIFRTSEVD